MSQRRRGENHWLRADDGRTARGALVVDATGADGKPRIGGQYFVNPIQFGPKEDFESYPERLESDKRGLKKVGVDVLFLPDAAAMYPEGFQTKMERAHWQIDGAEGHRGRGISTVF